jgi:biopolymer transport protein ExbD
MAAKFATARGGSLDLGQNSDINVTPFVDVMLVLLIIFMVVAAAATSAVKVDLPATPQTDTPPPRLPVTVSVTADGSVFVNDVRASIQDAPGLVSALIADGQHDDRVVVRADKSISYEQFMTVMSALNIGGVGKLALVSTAPSAP